jgi:DMSO reductase iron-sulfur subunit
VTSPASTQRVASGGSTGFALDLNRCVGCGACVLGCRIENELPLDVSWRRILQVNRPRLSGGPTYHLSLACHHCENPPCANACPSGALWKRPDGVVLLNADRCIGCRYCEMACPFGAPSFDERAKVMTKCHLCHHRLDEGLAPACVTACPTEALKCASQASEEGRRFLPATDVPGFDDPAGAAPGLWFADPGGTIRARWFGELKDLLGLGARATHSHPGIGREKP